MKTKKILFLFLISLLTACVQKGAVSSQGSVKQELSCVTNSTAQNLSDPQSIEELTAFINALPKPLDLSCFLKSLKRPLYVNATSSKLSAQPAGSASSPRIFIFKGDLIISIVPDGEGSKILEFSEIVNSVRTIKGEVALPINEDLSKTDPFLRINNQDKTSCSGCHSSERFESEIDGVPVYSSLAFKPATAREVSLQSLRELEFQCQSLNEKSERCLNLKSLFLSGEVSHIPFPEDFILFLNTFGN